MVVSIAVAGAGIFVAYKKYAKFDVYKPETEEGLIGNKFYIDEIYDALFVQSTKKLSTFIADVIDTKIIDGFVMTVSKDFIKVGKKLALIQNANVRYYAFYMLAGISSISLYLYFTLVGQ
jgi:NADH-quinone oxidoreductase subunit L